MGYEDCARYVGQHEVLVQEISSFCCLPYLIIVSKSASSRSDQVGVKKRKVVLYLTFHFNIRACAAFACSGYPPLVTVSEAVKKYPNIMWTIHLLSISLERSQKR